MSAIDELLAGNQARASAPQSVPVDAAPSRRVAIVTCMDARIDLPVALGLGPGEAHVLRNAGGVVTDDVIRSLAISQRRLGTREVMIVLHTDCGMQKLGDDEFTGELERDAGVAPPFEIGSFSDLETAVRRSIMRVRESPFLLHRADVRGFIYEVDAHRLREVQP